MLNARLSHLALGAAGLGRTCQFYEDHVGLRAAPSAPSGTTRLGLGSGGHVLELRQGTGLQHFALEIPDQDELTALVKRIRDSGVSVAAIAEDRDHPQAVTFLDPDGHRVELHARTQRDADAGAFPRHRPIGLHHITLSTQDVPTLVEFYTAVLGFAISDRMGDRFAWLRCNREHHTVAIVEGPAAGLDHYCYELADWDEFKLWCDTLAASNIEITWGPGRHGPGNNLFIFFDDPDGARIELSCEMERFWDGPATYAEPREWSPGMQTLNLWGPGPEWRKALERESH